MEYPYDLIIVVAAPCVLLIIGFIAICIYEKYEDGRLEVEQAKEREDRLKQKAIEAWNQKKINDANNRHELIKLAFLGVLLVMATIFNKE